MIKLKKLRHIAIIVTNMKEMINFYTNTLGFTLQHEMDIESEDFAKGVGVPGAKAKMTHLVIPDSDIVIELFEFANKIEPDKNMSIANYPGYRHIAFEVNNIEEIYEKLKGEGVEFISEIICIKEPPSTAGFKFVYFKDPEGNLIELTQLPNA